MKAVHLVWILIAGVVMFFIASIFRQKSIAQYNSPYSPGANEGRSPGGIITSLSNAFLSLFQGGVFGTGWGKEGNAGGVGTSGSTPGGSTEPDSGVFV